MDMTYGEMQAVETYYEMYDQTLEETVNGGLEAKEGEHQPWSPMNISRLTKIWTTFTRDGIIRDEKGLDKIIDNFLRKIVMVDVNTMLCGHTELFPVNEIEEKLEMKVSEEDVERISDFLYDETGQLRISDYALKPLQNLAVKMLTASTDVERLLLADSVLNVVHQRSDVASWFVEGGRMALDELQGG